MKPLELLKHLKLSVTGCFRYRSNTPTIAAIIHPTIKRIYHGPSQQPVINYRQMAELKAINFEQGTDHKCCPAGC